MLQRLFLPARGLVIAREVTIARSAAERVKGLLGTTELEADRGLVLETRQVHTFGMRYPIDVVFCSDGWRVLHLIRAMRPNRVSRVVLRARRVIELPAGAADQLEVGDRLALEESEAG